VVDVKPIGDGIFCAGLRVTWSYMDSSITQDIIFYAASPRIDFKTNATWVEQTYVVKAHFPLDVFHNDIRCDIQYGNVSRPTCKNTSWDVARFEVCAHKWADVSEAGYGFSLMNDCKYGYSVDENSIALTMLKSSTNPDPTADQCVHHFTYSILPHTGDWRMAGVPQMSYMLNVPVITTKGEGEKAILPPFVEVDQENVLVEVVKQELDGEGTIVRLYETYGMRSDVVMTLNRTPKAVKLTTMLEDELEDANWSGNEVRFSIKPYEILTFKIKEPISLKRK
jgi:alpha-mannosidase